MTHGKMRHARTALPPMLRPRRMAIYRCDRCEQDIIAPVGVRICGWCHSPIRLVVSGTAATPEEHEGQRNRIVLERVARILYGPGLRDFDRVAEARAVMQQFAPDVIPSNSPNGNGA
jgi:hypothetical protein